MERVQSKHLFNNQLLGVLDPEVAESAKNEVDKMTTMVKDLGENGQYFMQPERLSCEEFVKVSRKIVELLIPPMCEKAAMVEANKSCIHTKLEVPLRDGNDYAVPVLVHTPKSLEAKRDNPAVIYAHGGGAVSGTAEMFQPWLAQIASDCGVIYFNVDYRLAPETKCPKNALDFYCAVKHIVEHAADYGVDPQRIAIAGDSGGGYIVMATMVMLAQKDEGHLIKLAIPGIPMIDDYAFGDPKSMTKEERQNAAGMKKVWECIATNLDEQRKNSDPLLFPAKADDELLGKMPPTIIWEVEFDFFITEATRMARRLRNAGRLLELYIAPGMTHGATIEPDFKVSIKSMEDYKLALQTYLF